MPLSLRDKLRAVDAPKKPSPAAPQAPVFDDCWHGSKLFSLESVPGAWDIPMDMVRLMEPGVLPERLAPERILYLDTETTGLSGGAGTVAFLTGLGYLTDDGFLVHQYLMRDYPEERFLLENVRAMLPQFDVLCTFNGKSFDLPLLQSRFRIHPFVSQRVVSVEHLPKQIHAIQICHRFALEVLRPFKDISLEREFDFLARSGGVSA